MSAEPNLESDFVKELRRLLREGRTVNVLNLFNDNKHSEEVRQNTWDLVPLIAEYLSEDCQKNNIEVFKCCEKLLEIVTEQSKPEDVLLQFIEEIDATDDTKFLVLLKSLQKVLVKVPDKRVISLAWCFNSIIEYLRKLESPESSDLTSEERLLLDNDSRIIRILNLYEEVLQFVQLFLDELITANKNLSERKQILCKFLVDLLDKPLAHLPMNIYKTAKSPILRLCEQLVEKACSICPDPFVYLEMVDGGHNSDLTKPKTLALSIFYYFLMVEDVNSVPKVYNPVYILQYSLKFVTQLLSAQNQFTIEKGLSLASALLRSIDIGQLDYLMLDYEDHHRFCVAITGIITYNSDQFVRKNALEIFKKYLWSFEHAGRYLLVRNLMEEIKQHNLKGYIITQYKEMLRNELMSPDLSQYYRGPKLFILLNAFTRLPEKEKTDVVDGSDQIVSTLNFLRYLCIADKTGVTSIDQYWDVVEDVYINDLRMGINMAKPHYKQKILELKKGGDDDENNKDVEMNVEVAGKELLKMPTDNKIEVMNMSLTTLDVIDSLLNRFVECLSERRLGGESFCVT